MAHLVLQKHATILEKLKSDRVLDVCYDNKEKAFYINEQCDEWYEHKLTKEDCLELSMLFQDVAEEIERMHKVAEEEWKYYLMRTHLGMCPDEIEGPCSLTATSSGCVRTYLNTEFELVMRRKTADIKEE